MKKSSFLDTGLGVFLAAILANLLWGSASPCIKLGYQLFQISSDAVMSQIFFAGIRFTLAGILTVLLGSLVEHSWPLRRPSRSIPSSIWASPRRRATKAR